MALILRSAVLAGMLLSACPASASQDPASRTPPSEAPLLTPGPSDGLEPGEADALEERARARQKAGDLDGAIALFTAALRIDPQMGRARNNRGNVYRDEGEADLAARDYEEAARLFGADDPVDRSSAFTNLGRLRREQGRLAEALAAADEAVRANPREVRSLRLRADLRDSLGDEEGALADYAAAAVLAPSTPTTTSCGAASTSARAAPQRPWRISGPPRRWSRATRST